MNATNKSIVLAESARFVGQLGNNIVSNLYSRILEIEALTRTIGSAAETLPKSEPIIQDLLPKLIDFQGDQSIAGGGYWPEPYAYDPEVERRSFFWGRNAAGKLEYFDSYNQSEMGYHQEAWYVVARCAEPQQCFWSSSYMDPHSYQPMVTCTAPVFAAGTFAGAVTIDLKLEGLQSLVEAWRKKTGGYIFILDRENKFITFPDLTQVKKVYLDDRGNSVEEFIFAEELAEKEPCFSPISDAVLAMNEAILRQAQNTPAFDVETMAQLNRASYQIDEEEAELITAIMADPLAEENFSTYLYEKFEIERDCLLQEPAMVFLFHVPQAYWKVVIVKPFSEAILATYELIQSEKMSSLSQFVAGVAHEINNPINFIYGNLSYASSYTEDLLELVRLYQEQYPDGTPEIQRHLEAMDFKFLVKDLPKLLASMKVGAERIRQIVTSLRNFSRIDEAEIKPVQIHEGIESTLLLLESRLQAQPNRPEIRVIQEYSDLPLVECYAGPLNQVFMHLLTNAIDALDEAGSESGWSSALITQLGKEASLPTLRIRTESLGNDRVVIRIADNGTGIPESVQRRMFDPFFTTKPIGKGTGLGLSISYQIVTQRHRGLLRCVSKPGQGTEFFIEIPIHQPRSPIGLPS